MNEVSIIINGVRYDAVDKLNTRCSLCAEVINELCCNSSDNGGICYILKLSNKVFKKSDKKFEK